MAQLASGGTQASASDGGFERTAYLLARSLGYDDSLHDRCVFSFGRRDAQPLSLDATFVDGNSFDLGATEVNSDSHLASRVRLRP